VCLSYVNADRRVLSYPSEVTPLAELGPSLIALRPQAGFPGGVAFTFLMVS
jgi:hypothetical protein